MRVSNRLRRTAWLAVALLPLAALALVAFPVLYVQPFRPQSPQWLDRALAVRDISPRLTILLALLVIASAVVLWASTRPWKRAILVVSCLVILAGAALSRFDHFEAMFAPVAEPTFAKVQDVDFLEPGDLVLAVEDQGDAVAFPVRQLAYHHVVQEDVGGEPIVATY